MAYNPYGDVPGYGPPPSFNQYPGSAGVPPGMPSAPGLGPPPGMSAPPGMAPPPGVQHKNITQANRASGVPTSFQAPPNMPNINFNAPVIRLGTAAGKPPLSSMSGRRDGDTPMSAGPRAGLGMDRGGDHSRQAVRDSIQALVPPSNEEIVRTMFVDGITEALAGNAGVESILNVVGNLRKWERATDATGKELPFGFAQFDDAESLWLASELLREIKIPTQKQAPTSDAPQDDDAYETFDKSALRFKLDEISLGYLGTYRESRTNAAETEARLSAAASALKQTVRSFFYPPVPAGKDADGDEPMGEAAGQTGENVEVVNIPLAQEDELADIPAEMRETVAAEIASFRDRSIKRDMERLKREEELEALERQRAGGSRPSRVSSPPPATSSTNIPLGPRGVYNALSGPKSQKSELGRDYNRSVTFVNGGVTNGGMSVNREDGDSDASDGELERRRLAKNNEETVKLYLDAERRWLNRERSRTAALEREKERDETDEATIARKRDEMLEYCRNFDDDSEASKQREEYYADRSKWMRNRAAFRAREIAADDADRAGEEYERVREEDERAQARGMADSFLERHAREMEKGASSGAGVIAPQPFKLSLGAAAQRAQAQRAPQRKTIAEVEGLLEDEEEESTTRRQLVPIKYEPATAAAMSDEEREQAVRSLAQEIPSEKEGLWSWDVKWDFLDESVIRDKLRPFVEKKLVEYLGVQEQLLIEVVEEHLRKHGKPAELVEELAEALDDEAEALVKKLFRMVIFFTESESRGLSA